MKSRKGPKPSAILTVKKPGAWSGQGRRVVAIWLRGCADDLEHYGSILTDTGNWVCRYLHD